MKADIHPNYRVVKVVCTCGTTFETQSTYKKDQVIKLEICGACHPFYTGTQKLVDTERRIDKYYQKYSKKDSKENSK